MSSPTYCLINKDGVMRFTWKDKEGVLQKYNIPDIEVEVEVAVSQDWEGFKYETRIYRLEDVLAQLTSESERYVQDNSDYPGQVVNYDHQVNTLTED